MEHCKKAIHLRTGDQGSDSAVSTWLERHGVEVVACADPFEACAVALTQREPAPDLALIGADWLAPDEAAIIGYLRETWPGLTTVVYGRGQATAGFQATPATLVCRSAPALRRMLADAPDALLSRSLAAQQSQAAPADGWRPQPTAPPPEDACASPGDITLPGRTMPAAGAQTPAAEDAGRVSRQDSKVTVDKPAAASYEMLTREELAALLADDDE